MIQWCDNNEGFVSALLTIFALILSIIAIVVSLKTARLPYKKKLKLYSNTKYAVLEGYHGGVSLAGMSLTAGAVNLGNRQINIEYLGFGIYIEGRLKKLTPLGRNIDCRGILECTEMREVDFTVQELLAASDTLNNKLIYIFAIDSEGTIYKKKLGHYENLMRTLTK